MQRKRISHKKRKGYWRIAVIVCLLCAAVCGTIAFQHYAGKDAASVRSIVNQGYTEASGDSVKDIAANQELSLDERVEKIVDNMSDSEKVGQMLMIGIQGTEMNDDVSYMLNEYAVGGIILFDRNMATKEQVKKLNAELQHNVHGSLPPFIGIDEEGGRVARMREAFPPPPSQAEISSNGDAKEAEAWAIKVSTGLQQMGFNVNFAPVADVGIDEAGRMYSDDAETASRFVQAAAKGYAQENMICTLKHFPGIGKGRADTHDDFVEVNADIDTLLSNDILPFKNMFQQENNDDFWVMVTHVTYPAIDAKNPASMSYAVMNNLLRQQMGYSGIVITDDVDMGAIAKHYDFKEVGVKAVTAGADIVLVCHDYEHEADVYNGILQAVRNGTISQERLNDSAKRIVRAKLLHLM